MNRAGMKTQRMNRRNSARFATDKHEKARKPITKIKKRNGKGRSGIREGGMGNSKTPRSGAGRSGAG